MNRTISLHQRRDEIVREHVEAENSHDAERTIATFHHPRFEIVPFGTLNDGAKSVHQLLRGMFSAFPDLHVEILRLLHADDAVVAECMLTATHQGPFAGFTPKGRVVDLPTAAFFEFDGDRLMCEKLYFDMATLMRQIQ